MMLYSNIICQFTFILYSVSLFMAIVRLLLPHCLANEAVIYLSTGREQGHGYQAEACKV